MRTPDGLAVRRGSVLCSAGSVCWVGLEEERCSQCTGACGIALGPARTPIRVERADWPEGAAPRPGTPVRFTMSRHGLASAVVLTFGAPLVGLLVGAATGNWFHGNDAVAAAAGWMFAGLVMGAVAPWWVGRLRGARRAPFELRISFGDRNTEGLNR
jgi:hypothetical protein